MVTKRSDISGASAGRTAREKLLAAADELFYAEGIHTVGIDRIIKQAGVAKASLYGAFENKDDLVCTYLQLRGDRRRRRIEEHVAKAQTPRAKILAVFDALHVTVSDPKYRGCAFINASAEGPREDNKVTSTCGTIRAYTHDLFVDLARNFGAKSPTELGRRLALIYDGATVSASIERDENATKRAKEIAELLLDASAPTP